MHRGEDREQLTRVMENHDCLGIADRLQDRYGPYGIESATAGVTDHCKAFDRWIHAENLVRVQTRIRTAQYYDTSTTGADCLDHIREAWWRVVCLREFAFTFLARATGNKRLNGGKYLLRASNSSRTWEAILLLLSWAFDEKLLLIEDGD